MSISVWHPIVRAYIGSSLGAGWSANRIWNSLPDIGLPKFHRQTFLKVARYEREFLRVGRAVVEVLGNVRFPNRLMVQEEFDYDTKYRLHGVGTYYREDTDEEFEQNVQAYTDNNFGKDTWEEDFITKWYAPYEEEGLELTGVRWVKVVHDPRYSY